MLSTLIFFLSLLVVCFAIPAIIKISFKKQLFDDPVESRKVHKTLVPNFGGIAIFTAFLFASALLIPTHLVPQVNVLMAAGLILFMVGLQDDVVGVSPMIKFLAQLGSAGITTVYANLRITDLNGMFGVHELPYAASILLSVLFVVGIVNALNLIDGIDGLAGSLGIIAGLMFAYLFYELREFGWAYLSLSLSGALLGFLFFNISPAKIFMGDSGSLTLGFILAVLSLKFLQLATHTNILVGPFIIKAEAALVIGILIIPMFDTLRVLILRMLKNTSPFTADSNHLHHRLLFLGLSHVKATFVLSVVNVLFILMCLSMQQFGNTKLIGAIIAAILLLNAGLSLYIEQYKKRLLSSKYKDAGHSTALHSRSSGTQRDFGAEVLKKISEN